MSGSRKYSLAIGEDGDLDTSTGGLRFVDDLAQHVKSRLLMFEGEWFLDVSQGTPWLQTILVKGVNLGHARAAFRRAIVETPGVRSLESLNVTHDRSARRLTVTFRANGEPQTLVLPLP